MTDKLKEAIEVLKKVRHWIDYGAGELEPTANAVIEAIDTVVSEVEKPTYTADDMEAFAEWTAFMQWIYDNTDKCWFQKHSSETITTAQLRELWEQERREK